MDKLIDAIIKSAKYLTILNFEDFKSELKYDIDKLKVFPYIGDTLKYQIARNIGFDTIKPDIHLIRIAEHYNYDNPFDMCDSIANHTGDNLHLIDTILWRYMERGGRLCEKD